jgi:thioredoxin-like negative regulator of GroEL
MPTVTRLRIVSFLVCAFLNAFSQSNNPKSHKELSEAKQAFQRHRYEDALKHFKNAEKAQGGLCRECVLGVLRAYLEINDLKNAGTVLFSP